MSEIGEHGFAEEDMSGLAPAEGVHGRGWPEPPGFGVGNAYEMGWQVFKARYGLLLGASCLYLLIVFAASMVAMITSLFTLLPLVDWAAQFLFYPLMWIGLMWVGLGIIRGESGGVADLFAGFKRYWPVVGAQALVLLITYAIVLVPSVLLVVTLGVMGVGGAFGGSSNNTITLLVIVGTVVLLMIVPMLVVLPRIVLAPLVCLDTKQRVLGPVESFKTSWRMTGKPGVWGGLIVLWLLMVVISIVCAALLVLPVLFLAMPLGTAVFAAAYWQISRQYWRGLEFECNVCAYDLRGARAAACPECGAPIPAEKLGLI